MQPPVLNGVRPLPAPRFYVTERKAPRPAAILLALVTAASVLGTVSYGMGHSKARRFRDSGGTAVRDPNAATGADDPGKDEKDDPSQIDTVVLGDAADAPVPAHKGGRPSEVHATILIRLPRYGNQVGLIPDSPAGHLLYQWLAAFNQASTPALEHVLPNMATVPAAAVQMEMRKQTGGFNLLSAVEVQPGTIVFRLRDQTPFGNEVLGTMQMRAKSDPATIASLSLRAVPAAVRSGSSDVR